MICQAKNIVEASASCWSQNDRKFVLRCIQTFMYYKESKMILPVVWSNYFFYVDSGFQVIQWACRSRNKTKKKMITVICWNRTILQYSCTKFFRQELHHFVRVTCMYQSWCLTDIHCIRKNVLHANYRISENYNMQGR